MCMRNLFKDVLADEMDRKDRNCESAKEEIGKGPTQSHELTFPVNVYQRDSLLA